MREILLGFLVFYVVFSLCCLLIKQHRGRMLLNRRLVQMSGGVKQASGSRKRFPGENNKGFKLGLVGLERKLEQLDIPLKPQEYLAIRLVLMLPGVLTVGKGDTGTGFLLLAAGFAAPEILFGVRRKQRVKFFELQLCNVLLSLANALRAGFSFFQAMELICREEKGPLGVEFKRCLQEMSLGTPVEESLLRMQRRLDSRDLELVVTAILVQRQVGGDLSVVLEQIQWTIQERNRLKNELKALTSQGRLSGLIIGLLPVFLGAILNIINPDYMAVLFTEPAGRLMLIVSLVAEILGFWVISRIMRLDY